MSTDTSSTQHELNKVNDRICWLTRELQQQEGKRDSILRELADHEGASSNRYVGAR